MKLYVAFLLTISASSSSAASVRGKKVRNKEFPDLREGDVQNLCDSDKTFELGDDDCVISFDLDDLEPTSAAHVFKSHACGDEDPIIVTMDLEDDMPWHAARLNHRTNEWTELSELPDVPEYGCMYTTATNLGNTGNLLHDDERDDGERRELGIDSAVESLEHVDRELETTCSKYKVVRMAIRYDAQFCTEHGKGTNEGANAYINTMVEMANPFFNKAPLCIKVEICSLEGSCSSANDPYGDVKRRSTSVCDPTDDTNFLDNFMGMFKEGPPDGCDTIHLYVGGDTWPNDTIGCAELGRLCDSKAAGVTFMHDESLPVYVWLVAHELGHNLNADHVFGEDQYIMSYGYLPQKFKSTNIDRMVNFVGQKYAQDETCLVETDANRSQGATETPPSASSGGASCSGHEFDLELQTDENGDGISWVLEDPSGIIVAQGGNYPAGEKSFVEFTNCLSSDGEHIFKIVDSYGDGMEGDDAYYTLWYDGNVVADYDGGFGSGESIAVPGGNNV